MSELTKVRTCKGCSKKYTLADKGYEGPGVRALVRSLEEGRYIEDANVLLDSFCKECAENKFVEALADQVALQAAMSKLPWWRRLFRVDTMAIHYAWSVRDLSYFLWMASLLMVLGLGVTAFLLSPFLPEHVEIVQSDGSKVEFSRLEFVLTLPVYAGVCTLFFMGGACWLSAQEWGGEFEKFTPHMAVLFTAFIVMLSGQQLIAATQSPVLSHHEPTWIEGVLFCVWVLLLIGIGAWRSSSGTSFAICKGFGDWGKHVILIVLMVYTVGPVAITAGVVGAINDGKDEAGRLWRHTVRCAVLAPTATIPVYGNKLHAKFVKKFSGSDLPPMENGLPLRYRIFGVLAGAFGAMCAAALWSRLQEARGGKVGGFSALLALVVFVWGTVVSWQSFAAF